MATGVPDLASAREAWDAAERERTFWREHHAELLQQYPDQFVAMQDSRVVAVNADLESLLRELCQQGIEPTDVWLEFLATDPRRYRL